MSLDIDMAEIAQLYIEESVEGLDIMEAGLMNLDPGAADVETMSTIFRAAHSIKGGGATFGFTEISEFAHHVETLLDEMRQGQREVTKEPIDLMLISVDCLREMILGLADGGEVDTTRAKELEAQLVAMVNEAAPVDSADGDVEPTATAENGADESATDSAWKIHFLPEPNILKSCNDPLRLIRELKTLGELEVHSEGGELLEFDQLDAEECLLGWQFVLRGVVTLDQIEEVFAWVRDECKLEIEALCEPSATDKQQVESAKAESVELPQAAAAPATPKSSFSATKSAPKAQASGKESGSIRVGIDKVDALINLVGELVITQSMLSRFAGDFDFTQIAVLQEGLAQLSRNTRELQESVMQIRMLPISFAFGRFPRLVRDTSSALGKNVELRVNGENTELDKTVLEKIGDPLVHLVRNSLDHGLETPDVREAAGKPAIGVLELNAYHEGGNIVIEIIDDGAGINKDKVLAKAREKGLVGPEEIISDERINNLIFMAGFSTVDEVSDLSGRGVGMDVVRRNISDLGGEVSVQSETGKGSKITIRLPLTLAILDGQLVRVGKEIFVISLVSIVETVQVSAKTVNSVAGNAELFKLRDEYIPIVRLNELFRISGGYNDLDEGLLVVTEAGGQRVGIFVDDLDDQQQVVIKSLESNFRQIQGISGATILGDGTISLIVDVPGLIQLFFDKDGNVDIPATAVA